VARKREQQEQAGAQQRPAAAAADPVLARLENAPHPALIELARLLARQAARELLAAQRED